MRDMHCEVAISVILFLAVLTGFTSGIYPDVTPPERELIGGETHRVEVSAEERLYRHITRHYNRHVRPVYNSSSPIVIQLGITLTQIFDMDEKNQVLTTNVWLDQEWLDEKVKWNPHEFDNIKEIRVPCEKLWVPDIVLYNNADDYTRGLMQSKAMVSSDGRVFWPPPTKFRSTCAVDVTYFPFDDQTCTLKLGSWTYNGFEVDVTNRSQDVDLSNYIDSGEWELLGARIKRNVVYYSCCSEPFPDVTITLTIRRKTLFYMYNIVVPCIMMSALTLLVFCMPPESGEKIALGVTVLLAFSVFMLAIAEKMPETSDNIPLIGIYLTTVMAITSVSIIMTVMVLNMHYHDPSRRPSPVWLTKLANKQRRLNRPSSGNPVSRSSDATLNRERQRHKWRTSGHSDLSTGVNLQFGRSVSTLLSSGRQTRACGGAEVVVPASVPEAPRHSPPLPPPPPPPPELHELQQCVYTPPSAGCHINGASYSAFVATTPSQPSNCACPCGAPYCAVYAGGAAAANSSVSVGLHNIPPYSTAEGAQVIPGYHHTTPSRLLQRSRSFGCRGHSGVKNHEDGVQQSNHVYHQRHDDEADLARNARQDAEDEDQSTSLGDWRRLALVTDRLLFWVFLIVTMFTSLMFLVVIPLYNRKHT